jgi:hypothetical protein
VLSAYPVRLLSKQIPVTPFRDHPGDDLFDLPSIRPGKKEELKRDGAEEWQQRYES